MCHFPPRAFIIFLLESPLQTWDSVLALQPRSNEPEQQKHCVAHRVWLAGVGEGKSCCSFSRKGRGNTAVIVLNTNGKRGSLRSPSLAPRQPCSGAFSWLTDRNKPRPLLVQQHVLWLKINAGKQEVLWEHSHPAVVTALDCWWIGLPPQKRSAGSAQQRTQQEELFHAQYGKKIGKCNLLSARYFAKNLMLWLRLQESLSVWAWHFCCAQCFWGVASWCPCPSPRNPTRPRSPVKAGAAQVTLVEVNGRRKRHGQLPVSNWQAKNNF